MYITCTFQYSDKNCDWVCILCHRGFKERKFAKAHITSDSHGINIKVSSVFKYLYE